MCYEGSIRGATLKCSTQHSLFVFSYLCSPQSLLCSPRSLFCSTKNLNFQEVYYVLLEVYCVLLEVYCVLLKVYCVLLEAYYVLLEVYCVLLEAYCVLLGSLLCSTQKFSLTQENTFRHPKSASLLGERVHSTYAAMGGGGVWPLHTRLYKGEGGSGPCVCTHFTDQTS